MSNFLGAFLMGIIGFIICISAYIKDDTQLGLLGIAVICWAIAIGVGMMADDMNKRGE